MSYIYVMQNDGLPGLVQIGMTDGSPEVHAQGLSNVTGVLGRFTVARQWQLKDAAIYERRIHAVLGCYNVSGEHFRLPAEGAIGRITALLYSRGVVNEEGLTRDEAQAVREAAAIRAEQDRIEAVKRAEEARQRTIEAEVVRAQAEAARRSFIDRVQNAIGWCMTWALIEVGVFAELTDQRHQPGWQLLAHLVGVVGLCIVLKWPSAKQRKERDNSAREARERDLSAHGLPATRTGHPPHDPHSLPRVPGLPRPLPAGAGADPAMLGSVDTLLGDGP
jgi:hypothetical protein